jgi:hypothetical protein
MPLAQLLHLLTLKQVRPYYNRTRVALIVSFDGNRRVNIEAEDRVLRLIEFNTSRVVYIAA